MSCFFLEFAGSEGLAELLAQSVLDPQTKRGLERSARKLFSQAAVSFDRSAASADENTSLDRRLRAFLIRLSPFLPLTCAHKCIEWLLRRYTSQEPSHFSGVVYTELSVGPIIRIESIYI